MNVKFSRYAVLVPLLAGVFAVNECSGIERVTPDKLAEMARGYEQMLAEPVSNCAKICACLIKPGTVPAERLHQRLDKELKQSTNATVRATLLYLIAETHYWGAFNEFKRSGDKAVLTNSPAKVVSAYLSSLEAIPADSKAGFCSVLKGYVVSRLTQLATTSLYGETLTPELKAEMVLRFVDRVEAAKDGQEVWPLETKGRVYRNLGIAGRMKSRVRSEISSDFAANYEAMKVADSIGDKETALRMAQAIEEQFSGEIKGNVIRQCELFKVYKNSGHQRALPCIREICRSLPEGYLELYELSKTAEPDLSAGDRAKYLEEYLAAMERKEGKAVRHYRMAVQQLVMAGDYRNVIRFADEGLKGEGDSGGADKAYLWSAKGHGHRKNGEKVEALEAFKKSEELLGGSRSSRLRETVRKNISELGQSGSNRVERLEGKL